MNFLVKGYIRQVGADGVDGLGGDRPRLAPRESQAGGLGGAPDQTWVRAG